MDWTSAVVGIGGLLVAALSLWLSYKDRRSVHRELLYQKQVEAYTAVINALNPLYDACIYFIMTKASRLRLDNETRPQLRSETTQLGRQFHIEHQKWALFLPTVVHDEISGFFKVLNAISAPEDVVSHYPRELVYSEDPHKELAKAYGRVIAAARSGLGIEPLSEDILKLVGGVNNSERKKHKSE
jgi:hypothetical protein